MIRMRPVIRLYVVVCSRLVLLTIGAPHSQVVGEINKHADTGRGRYLASLVRSELTRKHEHALAVDSTGGVEVYDHNQVLTPAAGLGLPGRAAAAALTEKESLSAEGGGQEANVSVGRRAKEGGGPEAEEDGGRKIKISKPSGVAGDDAGAVGDVGEDPDPKEVDGDPNFDPGDDVVEFEDAFNVSNALNSSNSSNDTDKDNTGVGVRKSKQIFGVVVGVILSFALCGYVKFQQNKKKAAEQECPEEEWEETAEQEEAQEAEETEEGKQPAEADVGETEINASAPKPS